MRIHDGPKIGRLRYNLMRKNIVDAVNKNPMNTVTKKKMCITVEDQSRDVGYTNAHGAKYPSTGRSFSVRGAHSSIRGAKNKYGGQYGDQNQHKRRRQYSPLEGNSTDTPWDFSFAQPTTVNFNGYANRAACLSDSLPSLTQTQQR